MNGIQQTQQKPALAALLSFPPKPQPPLPTTLPLSIQLTPQVIKRVHEKAESLYQQLLPNLKARYPDDIPEPLRRNLRAQCQQDATDEVHTNVRLDIETISKATQRVINELLPNFKAQYPTGVPGHEMEQFNNKCHQQAIREVYNTLNDFNFIVCIKRHVQQEQEWKRRQQQQRNSQELGAQQARHTAMLEREYGRVATDMYFQVLSTLESQYPGGVPKDAIRGLRERCFATTSLREWSLERASRQRTPSTIDAVTSARPILIELIFSQEQKITLQNQICAFKLLSKGHDIPHEFQTLLFAAHQKDQTDSKSQTPTLASTTEEEFFRLVKQHTSLDGQRKGLLRPFDYPGAMKHKLNDPVSALGKRGQCDAVEAPVAKRARFSEKTTSTKNSYSELYTLDLKSLLKERGSKICGKRIELVARLQDYDQKRGLLEKQQVHQWLERKLRNAEEPERTQSLTVGLSSQMSQQQHRFGEPSQMIQSVCKVYGLESDPFRRSELQRHEVTQSQSHMVEDVSREVPTFRPREDNLQSNNLNAPKIKDDIRQFHAEMEERTWKEWEGQHGFAPGQILREMLAKQRDALKKEDGGVGAHRTGSLGDTAGAKGESGIRDGLPMDLDNHINYPQEQPPTKSNSTMTHPPKLTAKNEYTSNIPFPVPLVVSTSFQALQSMDQTGRGDQHPDPSHSLKEVIDAPQLPPVPDSVKDALKTAPEQKSLPESCPPSVKEAILKSLGQCDLERHNTTIPKGEEGASAQQSFRVCNEIALEDEEMEIVHDEDDTEDEWETIEGHPTTTYDAGVASLMGGVSMLATEDLPVD
jgi:hypothetical protein